MNFPIGEGSSAEIVAKKNSKSHSLRRVMELKDLEFGTRGWIGSRRRRRRRRCPGLNPRITESPYIPLVEWIIERRSNDKTRHKGR